MRKMILVASLAMVCCTVSASSADAGFPWNEGCPNCQPEKKSILQRLNDLPAFLVLCPGTEMGVVDYFRFKGCTKVECEKCGDEKGWLCRQRYIRYCSEVHCPYCQGGAEEDLPPSPKEVPIVPGTEEAPPTEDVSAKESDKTADDSPGKSVVFPAFVPFGDEIR